MMLDVAAWLFPFATMPRSLNEGIFKIVGLPDVCCKLKNCVPRGVSFDVCLLSIFDLHSMFLFLLFSITDTIGN